MDRKLNGAKSICLVIYGSLERNLFSFWKFFFLFVQNYYDWNEYIVINFVSFFLKKNTGHFGSGVASYFIFLRWVFWVNIFISVFICCFLMVPEVCKPIDNQKTLNLLYVWGWQINSSISCVYCVCVCGLNWFNTHTHTLLLFDFLIFFHSYRKHLSHAWKWNPYGI